MAGKGKRMGGKGKPGLGLRSDVKKPDMKSTTNKKFGRKGF
jgi:hypothetical protein